MNEKIFTTTDKVKKIKKFELWRESALMDYYNIDTWEIECEKNTITVFPEYLKTGHSSRFIGSLKKGYFSGKKLIFFFCFKKEKNDATYLGWVEEIKEKKKDDDALPPQITKQEQKNLVEDKLGDEENEENENNEQVRGELLEKIIQLKGEVITLLEQLLEEKRKSFKENGEWKNAEEIEKLKEEINQLEKIIERKKQELEKEKPVRQLNYITENK